MEAHILEPRVQVDLQHSRELQFRGDMMREKIFRVKLRREELLREELHREEFFRDDRLRHYQEEE